MSRADEPAMRPDDDEITTDVDPAWIASLRADTNGSAPSPGAPDAEAGGAGIGGADDEDEAHGWALAEPAWDPEATVGASDGLIERIRQEVRATPARPVTTAAPTPPPPAVRPSPPPSILEQPRPAVPVPGTRDRADSPAVETPAPAAAPSVEDLASTTVRWEPRQRLAATAPVTDTVLVTPPTHHGLDRTQVVIALIIAVALVIVVWLVVSSRGSDDPAPPVGSVPTSDGTDTSVVPSGSAPVDPDLPSGVGG